MDKSGATGLGITIGRGYLRGRPLFRFGRLVLSVETDHCVVIIGKHIKNQRSHNYRGQEEEYKNTFQLFTTIVGGK